MLLGYAPILQTAMGTALTWGVTALGAALCAFQPTNRKSIGQGFFLDGSLGFSAGVMLAASYWSLLQPAISLAEAPLTEGGLEFGTWSSVPVAIGFLTGAFFIVAADHFFPEQDLLVLPQQEASPAYHFKRDTELLIRRRVADTRIAHVSTTPLSPPRAPKLNNRLWLLMVAITVHNIPEGIAVGAAFGHVTPNSLESFYRARNLAIGMAIQNFPEGLAVSLPLRASGYSFWRSFWYGQLSGFVEPIAGLLGCLTVQHMQRLQPYVLAFAAGAMIFVVFDDVIPEANKNGNGRKVSVLACLGFVLMMVLDVGFAS